MHIANEDIVPKESIIGTLSVLSQQTQSNLYTNVAQV